MLAASFFMIISKPSAANQISLILLKQGYDCVLQTIIEPGKYNMNKMFTTAIHSSFHSETNEAPGITALKTIWK